MHRQSAVSHQCNSTIARPAGDKRGVVPAGRILQNGSGDVNMSQFAATCCAAPDRLGWHQLGDMHIDIKLGRIQTDLRKRPLKHAPLFEVVIVT